MTQYYSFQTKYATNGGSPYEPMDFQKAIPGAALPVSLGVGMRKELIEAKEQGPEIQRMKPRCCTKSKPCRTWVNFKPQYAGCGNTFMSWDAATDGAVQGCEVGKRDSRLWVADLSPEMYERSLISGAIWKPEPYSHPHARQLFVQYLNATKYPDSSPYTKKIDNLSDTYCAIRAKYGEPQYTSF